MLFHLCNSKRPCDENLKVVSHVHIKVALENSFSTMTLALQVMSADY